MVSEGYLGGFPGPTFVCKRRVQLDGLAVKYGDDSIDISSLRLKWSIRM